ncbi:MAG: monovalent cation/H+ antiporter subunit D [Amaricoccus sp.]|uniref:monovalent cation/H+ antiporter subunit D n=1 Tax=Amaricoccus sp. TaxID=1872485 RepID=UPI0039E5E703
MNLGPDHILIAPILIPLVAGALMLFYGEAQRRVIAVISTVSLVVVALELVDKAAHGSTSVGLYLLGDWPPPFAIVLVLDRLSALMVLLTSILALSAVVFAMARWDRRGQHFHSLFQFLLMGLNGAFLTGDLFNLFVFFEVLLAASYGLALHGSGTLRVRAGLHYIAINLAASLLFLIGVSLIYGVTGTLNMADLAVRVPLVAAEHRPLLAAGAAILGIAFLVKAAMWPLCFWLPITYMAAPPPAAAIFAVLSKVGIYVVLRVSSLAFGTAAAQMTGLGSELLIWGGFTTLVFGTVGVLASQGLGRLAGCSVLVSSGTLLAVIGISGLGGGSTMVAGALFYLVISTIAISALFLMVELIERGEGALAAILTVTAEAYGLGDDDVEEDAPRSAGSGPGVPGATTVLGFCFLVCALLLAGVPPLAGFLGKFAMLSAVLSFRGLGGPGIPAIGIGFTAAVIVSGLAALIALVREGIRTFWAAEHEELPSVPLIELVPVLVLLALTLGMTVKAGPIMHYMEATAISLHHPHVYVRGVLGAATMPEAGE